MTDEKYSLQTYCNGTGKNYEEIYLCLKSYGIIQQYKINTPSKFLRIKIKYLKIIGDKM